MKILFSAVILVLLLLNAPAVDACSCGNYPTPCQSYEGAHAVFIGVVQNVETRMTKGRNGKEYGAGQVAHIQVEKAFKGTVQPEVIFRTEGSSCDPTYKEGQRWLLYAYHDQKTRSWRIAACDRSTRIEGAADDLLYLQGLPKSASTTRLSGELKHYEDDPEKGFSRVKNVSGVKVTITGEGKSYEVYTDKDGVYEIYGLPPGKYTVEPEIPVGLKVRFPMNYGALDFTDRKNVKLILEENSCASKSFVLSSNNRIAGRVIGADGQVLPRVCLRLALKGKSAASNWSIFDCTDKEGRYELTEIPPGEYLIVANDDGKISSNAPFPMAYFPGVFEKEKATVLTIAQSTNLEDYDIHIPSQESRKILQGVLQYSDGRPVADESVEFKANKVKKGFDGTAHTTTDDQGRFTLVVLEGLSGSLRGYMTTYKGEYVNCPKLDKLIDAKGGYVCDIGTKPMPLEITRDMQDIKLTLPFPYCEKAKRDQ
ncbi:MAG TPA: carboxypeptidase-like regulatory domain-containing protein [Pyrinomonadaceae bacterium]